MAWQCTMCGHGAHKGALGSGDRAVRLLEVDLERQAREAVDVTDAEARGLEGRVVDDALDALARAAQPRRRARRAALATAALTVVVVAASK